jgi:hypothetical protein
MLSLHIVSLCLVPTLCKVSLMRALPGVPAVMDANLGVAAVADRAVVFLWNLSCEPSCLPGLRSSGVKAQVEQALAATPTAPMVASFAALLIAEL